MKQYALIILLCAQSFAYADELRLRPDDWASKIIGSGLENFYQIDKMVFRSEQPNRKEFERLERFGIREVLNLRELHTDKDEAKKTDLVLHRVKMNTDNVSYEEILQALQTIKSAKSPILIHCWHGSDRTGVVSAAYRMVFQNWSKDEAIDEFVNGGYGYHKRFYPELVSLLENIDVGLFRKKLGLDGERVLENKSNAAGPKNSSSD